MVEKPWISWDAPEDWKKANATAINKKERLPSESWVFSALRKDGLVEAIAMFQYLNALYKKDGESRLQRVNQPLE